MESISNKENKQSINCYFFCELKGKAPEFIGFNKEQLNLDNCDFSNMIFENKQMYYFQKLEKKGKILSFINNLSSISKNNGIILNTNLTNYDSMVPYSLTGKIIKKTKEQILLLLSATNDIIVLTEIGDKFQHIEENQYIKISYIKFI